MPMTVAEKSELESPLQDLMGGVWKLFINLRQLGKTLGHEADLRWRQPQKGAITDNHPSRGRSSESRTSCPVLPRLHQPS